MYCSQCGKEMKGDARYCPYCKAKQEYAVVPTESVPVEIRRKKIRDKGRKLGNLLVSVIALMILFTANRNVSKAPVFVGHAADTSYMVAQNPTETIICSTEGEWCAIDTPLTFLYSADHKKMAYIDLDQELYYMDGIQPVFVDDKVLLAELSLDGDTLAYLRASEGGLRELCICPLLSEANERILVGNCNSFVLSSDGKTAAYLEIQEDMVGTLSVWEYGHKERKIADQVLAVLSVTNGGRELFYIKETNQLSAYAWDGEHRLSSLSGDVQYLLNETQTELLCTDQENTYYCTSSMQKATRINGVKGMLFFSSKMQEMLHPQGVNGRILNSRTLKNRTFVTYDDNHSSYKIYQLDSNGEEAQLLLKTSAL